ncbi:MAG: DNA-3-methyladenine glycosylase 2 family protein [Oscillospiraceae bacterium]|nr:DNA-3-methyladenine glycosylase 2 family protein [Oscillospiraceae bacterium]
MEYLYKNSSIILKASDFDLDDTLNCGQAFRWERENNNAEPVYFGFMKNTPLTISQKSDSFIFHDTSEEDFIKIWAEYFDLYTDYGEIKSRLSEDETLAKAISYADGIRILKQDKWEALCSFIFSQNNNIPRIKGIIKRLCEYHNGFPCYSALSGITADDLSYLRAGFRAKYIADCVDKLVGGAVDLDEISKMPIDDARLQLRLIKGVGAKVADCALLFGMYRLECFPEDVWVKKVKAKYYPNGLPDFTEKYAGIAQQYLFHYERNNFR